MAIRAFESWIDGIFDHPVAEKAWHWHLDADVCVEDDVTNAGYLAKLFRHSGTLLSRFDDAQVNQGLWMIANPACSDHSSAIAGGDAPWDVREDAIRSIFELNDACFSYRCTQALSHLDEASGPLNSICYMWWDMFPIWGKPGDEKWSREGPAYLDVLSRCLQIPHIACQEGALHGLGHLQMLVPTEVASIVDRFIDENKSARSELISYARQAQDGYVQ